jgi:hypothetical protein
LAFDLAFCFDFALAFLLSFFVPSSSFRSLVYADWEDFHAIASDSTALRPVHPVALSTSRIHEVELYPDAIVRTSTGYLLSKSFSTQVAAMHRSHQPSNHPSTPSFPFFIIIIGFRDDPATVNHPSCTVKR